VRGRKSNGTEHAPKAPFWRAAGEHFSGRQRTIHDFLTILGSHTASTTVRGWLKNELLLLTCCGCCGCCCCCCCRGCCCCCCWLRLPRRCAASPDRRQSTTTHRALAQRASSARTPRGSTSIACRRRCRSSCAPLAPTEAVLDVAAGGAMPRRYAPSPRPWSQLRRLTGAKHG
jgi:hypothetical protein